MKNKILSVKGLVLMSIVPMLFLCLSFTSISQNKKTNKVEAVHTFLIKIPTAAGVCPYELMMMTKGKLQMVNDPQCVCPYQHTTTFQGTVFMTARSKDVNSIRAMLPECIRNSVQIQKIDKTNIKKPALLPNKLYTSITN